MSEQAFSTSNPASSDQTQAPPDPSLPETTATNPESRYTDDDDFFAPGLVIAECKASLFRNTLITYREVDGNATDFKRGPKAPEPFHQTTLHVKYNSLSHSILGSNARSDWIGAPEDGPDAPTIHEMYTIGDIDEGGNLVSAMQLVNPNEIPIPDDLVLPEGHTHVSTCDIVATDDLTQFPPTMTRVWTANTPDNPLGNNQAARRW